MRGQDCLARLREEVLVANGVTLIDETGPDVFKKVKDGARVRLNNGGVYSGDRRIAQRDRPPAYRAQTELVRIVATVSTPLRAPA